MSDMQETDWQRRVRLCEAACAGVPDSALVPGALAAALRDVAALRRTFTHTHAAGPSGDIDTCRTCGLDIRNEIHLRAALGKGDEKGDGR